MDWANTFCSVPISAASQLWFAFISQGTQCPFSSLRWGTSAVLPSYVVRADEIFTTPAFLQEHRYDITLMTSCSQELHWTHWFRTHKSGILWSTLGSGSNTPHLYTLLPRLKSTNSSMGATVTPSLKRPWQPLLRPPGFSGPHDGPYLPKSFPSMELPLSSLGYPPLKPPKLATYWGLLEIEVLTERVTPHPAAHYVLGHGNMNCSFVTLLFSEHPCWCILGCKCHDTCNFLSNGSKQINVAKPLQLVHQMECVPGLCTGFAKKCMSEVFQNEKDGEGMKKNPKNQDMQHKRRFK